MTKCITSTIKTFRAICEQLEHTAQLKFREWLGRFQQQQEQRAPINRVMNL